MVTIAIIITSSQAVHHTLSQLQHYYIINISIFNHNQSTIVAMSAHNSSGSDFINGKTQSPTHHQTVSSSADSVYSETSSYYPVKDNASPKPSKSSSLKSWTKDLISDLGKSPTHRHDAVHGTDTTKQTSFWHNPHTKI